MSEPLWEDLCFEEGDRIVCIKNYPDNNHKIVIGMQGTVRAIAPDTTLPIGVEWDQPVGGHALNGLLPEGSKRGFWVHPTYIAHIEEEYEDGDVDVTEMFQF